MVEWVNYEWVFEDEPLKSGWYAIAVHAPCWSLDEGLCSGTDYWNGIHWDSYEYVCAYAGPFSSEAEADLWEFKNSL